MAVRSDAGPCSALDERQYVGAYSAAIVLGLFSLILVVGSELIRRREHV